MSWNLPPISQLPLIKSFEVTHGEIVSIDRDWHPVFVLIPRTTVSGKSVWLRRVYRRKIQVYSGFVIEPEYQYAELFDLLRNI